MDVLTLILDAQRDGLFLSLTSSGDLELRGEKAKRDKWRPRLLARRPDIVAALLSRELPLELEVRLRKMAKRWMYTSSELRTLLTGAKEAPEMHQALVELDERDFGDGEVWLSLG